MGKFNTPPITKNEEDELRKAGFELEFSNIDMETILNLLVSKYNFKSKKINDYLYKLESEYGEFTLELDFELLTKQKLYDGAKELSKTIGLKIEEYDIKSIENLIAELSQDIVPYEISTPPIPIDKLDIVKDLVEHLSSYNAKGTGEKIYYAFGLHINMEIVSSKIESILDYLRAYLILQDFINKDAKIDLARKISPFIDNFKKDYILHILNENYTPSKKEFIEDYIRFNPSRNRSLDMLPILAFLDDDLVSSFLPKEKIKPRPAFHYRLSNSRIGENDWDISEEWNRWVLVENLANDKNSLRDLSKEYIQYLDNLINLTTWEKRIEKWLENH